MNLLTGQAEMSVLPAGCSVELKLTERKFHSQSSIELQGLLFLFKNIGGHQSSLWGQRILFWTSADGYRAFQSSRTGAPLVVHRAFNICLLNFNYHENLTKMHLSSCVNKMMP